MDVKRLFVFLGISLMLFSGTFGESYFNSGSYVEPSCSPYFVKGEWSSCLSGTQERILEDHYSCVDDIVESRNCRLGFTEDELSTLNTRSLDLEQISSNVYSSNFTYVSILEADMDYGDNFIIYNPQMGLDYLARQYDSTDSIWYYSLEIVDKSHLLSGELEDFGLITYSFGESVGIFFDDLFLSEVFQRVLMVISFMVLITGIMGISFYIKRIHRKQLYHDLSSAHDHHTDSSSVDESTLSPKARLYSKYISDLKSYAQEHGDEPVAEIRGKLEKVGWNKDILDAVFKKE